MADKITDLRDRWDALRGEYITLENESTKGLRRDDPRVKSQEARVALLNARIDDLADAAWAVPARDLDDLVLLSALAFDRFFDLRDFPAASPDDDDYDRLAVAYLVKGVVDVAQKQAIADAALVGLVSPGQPSAQMPEGRREPSGALIAEIARMVASVAEDEAAIGVLSTGEAIAVALVLNRADLMPHGGYTWIEAVERLGFEWLAAAQAVQRQRDVPAD